MDELNQHSVKEMRYRAGRWRLYLSVYLSICPPLYLCLSLYLECVFLHFFPLYSFFSISSLSFVLFFSFCCFYSIYQPSNVLFKLLICLPIYSSLFIYPSTYLSIHPFVCICVYLFIQISFSLSLYIYQPV